MPSLERLLGPPLPVIHAVTDSSTVLQKNFVDRAKSVMTALGNKGAVHLRCSRASGKQFYDIALELASLQESTGCWLIVNDRVDVARAVDARGVQLASHSIQVSEAIKVAPDLLIGASVHSIEEAVDAEKAGASWCVAGTIFETPSHRGRPPARIEFITQLSQSVLIPVIAIGGVTPENTPDLIRAGAYGVATIRGSGWHPGASDSSDADLMITRMPVPRQNDFIEPVTRYISAYDSVSTRGRNDHPDGERSTT